MKIVYNVTISLSGGTLFVQAYQRKRLLTHGYATVVLLMEFMLTVIVMIMVIEMLLMRGVSLLLVLEMEVMMVKSAQYVMLIYAAFAQIQVFQWVKSTSVLFVLMQFMLSVVIVRRLPTRHI